MKIGEWAQEIAEGVWGFVPNRDIKPVHMANEMFRQLTQQEASPDLLQLTGAGYFSGKVHRRNGQPVTSEQLKEDLREKIIPGDRVGEIELDRLDDLRSALDLVLHQDRAFFGNSFFTPTLTHRAHTTSDPSGRGSGRFLARLLLNGAHDVAEVVRATLDQEDDNIYLLTAPLLPAEPLGPAPDTRGVQLPESPATPGITSALTSVAAYRSGLEKTVFLQRFVTMAGFGIFLHLSHSGGAQAGKELAPMLLCADDPTQALREASRSCFRRAQQRVIEAFEDGVRRECERRGEHELDERGYLKLVKERYLRPEDDDKLVEQFSGDFEAEVVAHQPFEAFVRAITGIAFSSMGSGHPNDTAKYLGRYIGLIYPRIGGRGDRYYRPGPQFLDALVSGLIGPDEEPLPIEDFWARARSRFGVVVGATPAADARLLDDLGLYAPPVADLRENSVRLLAALMRMGHARDYADGVAVVLPKT